MNWSLTLRRPLRRKLRMRWFWDFSKLSSFVKSDLIDLPSDFWCESFGKYRFKPFQISFLSGFYNKIMFWLRWFSSLFERMRYKRKTMFFHTNHPIIISFYLKKIPLFAELAMSERWSAIFCVTGAWGSKSIGRALILAILHPNKFYQKKTTSRLLSHD